MKKLILLFAMSLSLYSCMTPNEKTAIQKVTGNLHVIKDTIEHIKIVKTVKEVNETSTDYEYKYDWVNGKFRQQPKITSEMKYFIIYIDGSHEETSKDKGMFYTKGDTIKTYSYIYN